MCVHVLLAPTSVLSAWSTALVLWLPFLTLGAHAQRGLQYLGLCVCVSVKSHLTSRMSNRAINEHAYLVAYERQKICGDLPETTAFKR